ncbi:citrate lyase subunit beta/citryl-CoA lyase [Kribbella orskensis]|uniref:Citrate lyase subunit beta/citryl-CoA lyase n=1 Tax=Kribbella orskensis TaxID=2512216 RepID=A0ABY2BAF5_9ACTN|nr:MULTISPECIES: CoA ester lyase [Kribbella]TCN33425.1 citrate lyase subunit beta/citryl-CoA lyase [Kribbella sp. VKM Ac-2500]TCO13571.1 citrate lyase subunit beta/citryl-CoA lyase [Kribbella orskensis]
MLTALYVPANRPDRFAKAVASGPDLVVFDLEDAVPVADKVDARGWAVAWVAAFKGSTAIEVRVNAPGTPWIEDDLAALAAVPAVRIRLPKVESADDVRQVLQQVPSARITALIESPLGLERAFEIASADRRVVAVALGEADLASSLGVDGPEGLAWARGRIVSASRAAGLGAPMLSAYPHVKDEEGLRRTCLEGRALGFVGRTAIHPRQLPTIVECFTPSASQVADAAALLAAVAKAGVADGGVIVLPDGRMVDPAMLGRAHELTTLMQEIESRQN